MKTLNVAKAALYGIFLNYYCYYVIKGSFIPGGTVIFLGVAAMFVGMDVVKQRYVYVGTEIKCWIAYAILSLATTAITTMNSSDIGFISDIVKYIQRVAIVMMVAYICEREDSVRFGLQLTAVTAVGLAIGVLSVTGDFQLKLDITSNANLSENDTGAILAFGCFALLFAWGNRKKVSLLLTITKTTGIVLCLVVMFLAGSRKSIMGLGVMLAVLLVLCSWDYLYQLDFRKVFVMLVTGIAIYFVVVKMLLPYAEQTSLYRRLFGMEADVTIDSDEGRIRLIRYALEDFREHPLFGLGFNQYTKHHGNYSHCTYVEPLACSGLIGLLYLYPYYSIVKKQIYLILNSKKGSAAQLKQKEILAYLAMFLFIAVGIPYMYKDVPCILLGTFIASQAISFKELRTAGQMSADY